MKHEQGRVGFIESIQERVSTPLGKVAIGVFMGLKSMTIQGCSVANNPDCDPDGTAQTEEVLAGYGDGADALIAEANDGLPSGDAKRHAAREDFFENNPGAREGLQENQIYEVTVCEFENG